MLKERNVFFIGIPILVLFFITIRYLFDFNGLYGQDSYDYLRFSRVLVEYFKTGNDPGSFFWPVNYPLIGAIIALVFQSEIFSMQLLSYLSFILAVLILYKIIKYIYQPSKILIVLFLTINFLLSPYILRAGIVIMADMLALVFCLSAFLCALKYLKSDKKSYFIFALAFSFLAGFTRYHAFVILTIPMLVTTFMVFKRRDYLLFIYSFLISAIIILPSIWLKGNDLSDFSSHQWFTDWSPMNWVYHSFNTTDGAATYRFPNIIYGFIFIVHPAFFIIGLAIIPFLRKQDFTKPSSKLILAMIVLNGLFIAGIPFQNLRFHILIYPFALVLMFPAFMRFYQWISSNLALKRIIIGFILFVQIFLFSYLFKKFQASNHLEKHIANSFEDYQGNPVYTFAIDQAIKTYKPEIEIKNIWYNNYENFQEGSLFLFNKERFEKQWKGKNPWLNWENVNKNHKLKPLEKFPEGWMLYEIQ